MNVAQENLGDRLLREEAEQAFEAWGRKRPRKWMAKYGGLTGVTGIKNECIALLPSKLRIAEDSYLPSGTITLGGIY